MWRAEHRRRIYAWLLLLVFVPALVATSLHIHEGTAEVDCELCLHHVRHAGHLEAYHAVDCPLCQFAGLPYIAAAVMAIAVAVRALHAVYADSDGFPCVGVCGIKSTRAPPAIL